MADRVATMRVREADSKCAVIEIAGDVTSACDAQLEAAHQAASDLGAQGIVLDFSGLEYMNSGGIGMLVTLLVRTQRQNQRLAAVGLSEHYQQIFELTRIDEAIVLYADEASALSALAVGGAA
jgi:anti-sigma B factor antagonist